MRVLVTGASAPLGRAIVDQLLRLPEVTFVLAVAKGHRPAGLDDTRRCRYRRVDLTHPREAHDLLWGDAHRHAIEVVVHAAQHRSASDRGREVHAQNVDATRELLLGCFGHPTIRRFVHRSHAEVYALPHTTTNLLGEDDPLDFDPSSPQWVRDRVEADLSVCSHLGGGLQIAVLRCAELFVADSGSQLWDYLQSGICFRPLGYDPMINVLSLEDAVEAFMAAIHHQACGVFNIVGADTLPLSAAIEESSRIDVPIPGPLLSPLYRLRHLVAGFEFRYDLNVRRFHYGGILDGTHARTALDYEPRTPVQWPQRWWRRLLVQLGTLRVERSSS